MKRRLAAAAACGVAAFAAALAAPPPADRGYFAAMLAPALMALALPFGLPVDRRLRDDAALPPAAGLAVLLGLLPFLLKSPGFGPALGAGFLLACWAALIAGVFRAAARFGAAFGHLAASGLGLLLCATHLLADPLVAAAGENAGLRRAVIGFVVQSNPSLVLSAGFWERDLLMSGYMYARSDIGAYHAHFYSAWGWTALAYAVVGAAGWALGKRLEADAD